MVKAKELGTLGDYETTGKTPWATIAAYCYTDINRGGDQSMIIQTSERPAQFFLRELVDQVDIKKIQKQRDNEAVKEDVKKEKNRFKEISRARFTYNICNLRIWRPPL